MTVRWDLMQAKLFPVDGAAFFFFFLFLFIKLFARFGWLGEKRLLAAHDRSRKACRKKKRVFRFFGSYAAFWPTPTQFSGVSCSLSKEALVV